MIRKFTATIAAGAIALTGFAATPAQALDEGETLRLLLGVGALAAIASAAHNKNKDKDRNKDSVKINAWPNDPYYNGNVQVKPYQQQGVKTRRRATLPAKCETVVPTRRGDQRFFGEPCLKRSGFHAKLPQKCAKTLDFGRREVKAYGKTCLQKQGYRVGYHR